jgi:DNA-binding CsgD family transcriptional regulator
VRAGQMKAVADLGTRVGDVLHRGGEPSAVLADLRRIAAFDAVMLSAWDPLARAQRPLVSTGYGAALLRFLNTSYLSCTSYRTAQELCRPMRMQDFGPSFYRTPVYRDFLRTAGFREGVTLVLHSPGPRGQLTGLLTMSFTETRAADGDVREALELAAPALAQLVDVCLPPVWMAGMLWGGSQAVLVDARGASVPLNDAVLELSVQLRRVTADFLVGDQPSLRGFAARSADARWERAQMVRLAPDPRTDGPRALVMVAHTALPHELTERELDVLTLVSRGLSNRETGVVLGTSPRTVSTHVEHLLLKTGLANRAGLASYAVDNGVLRLDL